MSMHDNLTVEEAIQQSTKLANPKVHTNHAMRHKGMAINLKNKALV